MAEVQHSENEPNQAVPPPAPQQDQQPQVQAAEAQIVIQNQPLPEPAEPPAGDLEVCLQL